MELALDSVDTDAMEIEANAEKMRASELVKQFKTEMGMGEAEEQDKTTGKEEKKIDLDETDSTKEKSSGRTVGNKDRTKS
jgi:phage shock protein A